MNPESFLSNFRGSCHKGQPHQYTCICVRSKAENYTSTDSAATAGNRTAADKTRQTAAQTF